MNYFCLQPTVIDASSIEEVAEPEIIVGQMSRVMFSHDAAHLVL